MTTEPITSTGMRDRCACAHLGDDVHDPTNPHCALFNGADLRLAADDIPDEEGLQPPRTTPDGSEQRIGDFLHGDEYAAPTEPDIHRLPAITLVDTSEDEHRAKAAKLARSNHAFTNFGDPAGLCNVCGAGAGNEIHTVAEQHTQPTNPRDIGVHHTVIHFDRGMSYAWCGVYKADHLTGRMAEVTCSSCLVVQTPPVEMDPDLRWRQVPLSPISEPIPIMPTLETLTTEITLPQLMVNVDFNELFRIEGEEKTFVILTKLKEMLS